MKLLVRMAAGALAVTLCTGCVVAERISPDHQRRIEVVRRGGALWVRHGKPVTRQGPFAWVAHRQMVFAAASVAYPAATCRWEDMGASARFHPLRGLCKASGRWVVVHDGRLSAAWPGIGAVALSPDGGRLAYAAERAGRWHVVVDGRVGPAFAAVQAGSLKFAEDGRCVYVAYRGKGRAVLSVDGRISATWEWIGGLSLRGGRVAFVAGDGAGFRVVVDGVAGPVFAAVRLPVVSVRGRRVAYVAFDTAERVVLDGNTGRAHQRVRSSSLRFSDDETRLAYAAVDGGRWRMFVDGAPGGAFDEVDDAVFAPDGGGVAYLGRRGHRWFIAGSLPQAQKFPAQGFDRAADLTIAPGGRSFGLVAWHGKEQVVMVDRDTWRFPMVLQGSLVFSADGAHWGCVVGNLKERTLALVIDGARRRSLEFSDVMDAVRVPGALRDSASASAAVAGWVRLQLTRSP